MKIVFYSGSNEICFYGSNCELDNVASSIDCYPSGNKPLPEPTLKKLSDAM